jgi:hypothetical protein
MLKFKEYNLTWFKIGRTKFIGNLELQATRERNASLNSGSISLYALNRSGMYSAKITGELKYLASCQDFE